MATIQVRDIDDDAYETIRRRARAAGKSIQAYMKEQIEAIASRPTEEELFDRIEQFVQQHGTRTDPEQIVRDIDHGR